MKCSTTLVIFLCFTCSLIGQQIKLDKGEEFTFHTSCLTNTTSTYLETQEYHRYIIQCTVLEVDSKGYRMGAKLVVDQLYKRQKYGAENWKSLDHYSKQLDEIKIHDRSFTFTLSVDGAITEEQSDPVNPLNIHWDFSQLFLQLPERSGDLLTIDNRTYEIDSAFDEHTSLVLQQDTSANEKETLLVDESGVVVERILRAQSLQNEQVRNPNTGETETFVSHVERTTRTVLVREDHSGFHCKTSSAATNKDTVLSKTNIRVRGKIDKLESLYKMVTLAIKQKAPLYARYPFQNFSVQVDSDGTFELRAYISEVTEVMFNHGRHYLVMNLLPGDDIWLAYDDKDFHNTLKISGVGANQARLGEAKYFFEKDFDEGNSEFYHPNVVFRRNYYQLLPKEVKNNILSILSDYHAFLDTYDQQYPLPAEVYLASFWQDQMDAFRVLSLYRINTDEKKAALNGVDWRTYSAQDSLIHPDNDLMAFARDYKDFLGQYALNLCQEELYNSVTGVSRKNVSQKGIVWRSQNQEFYNFAQFYLTGQAQYFAKYWAVERSLKNDDWAISNALYQKFAEEYPEGPLASNIQKLYVKYITMQPGKPAYNFTLKDRYGKEVHLSDFKGKVVYLSFWDAQSGQYILPNIEKMCQAFADEDIVFVNVALWSELVDLEEVIGGMDLGITLLPDHEEGSMLTQQFMFNTLHYFTIIDTEGRIYSTYHTPSPLEVIKTPDVLQRALDPG